VSAPHEHAESARGRAGIDTVEHLVEHLAEIVTDSMVIVCVGSDLRGDDGAGVAVAKQLAGTVRWQVFNTQCVPESYLMKIVDCRPASVLLIDALDFGAAAGAVELVEVGDLTGQGPSTHGPAPLAFLDILAMMHPCRRAVLGIQPAQIELDQPLSQAVAAAVEMVVQALRTLSAGRDQR